MLPNGENAHITVRSPDWWKGIFDAISLGYENIEVMLICSNTFTSGVIFEKSFKFNDWASTEGFTTTMSFKTFQPNEPYYSERSVFLKGFKSLLLIFKTELNYTRNLNKIGY